MQRRKGAFEKQSTNVRTPSSSQLITANDENQDLLVLCPLLHKKKHRMMPCTMHNLLRNTRCMSPCNTRHGVHLTQGIKSSSTLSTSRGIYRIFIHSKDNNNAHSEKKKWWSCGKEDVKSRAFSKHKIYLVSGFVLVKKKRYEYHG